MTVVSYSVEDLVPHRDPMRLIDEIVSYSAGDKSIAVAVNVTESSPFYDSAIGGVPNWIAVEYMAQASAALAGIREKEADGNNAPRPGILLGSRKIAMANDKFACGERYLVSARDAFDDGTTASFECEIKDSRGEVVATASLTAYRPEDFTEFLKERTSE